MIHRTFADELDRRVAETPDKVFLWFDDTPLTFAAAQRAVRSAANQLLALGVEPGDTVALLTASCADWVCTWLACAQIGAVSMPINVMFRGDFLLHQLQDSRAKLIVVDQALYPQLAEITPDLGDLRTVLVRGGPVDPPEKGAPRILDASLLSDGRNDTVTGGRPLGWNEVACLFYTSGTTGPAKGALLTQQYLCVAADVLAERYGLRGDDVVYAAMPLFHLGGAYGVVVGSLISGRTAILDRSFSVSRCWERVRRYGATVFLGVGPMVAMLHALPPEPEDAELPIRLIIAAPVPAELHAAVEARYGCAVAQCYGQTEAIPIALTDMQRGERVPGSAGTIGPLHSVRVVDDADGDVPPGAVGEIVIRPRYPHVMFEGYLNQPDATLAQMRNLWFHTGDLGRLDDHGNLWWVDRKKDAIRRRGENISSYEVEQSILAHPSVAECAAHAVPSSVGEDDLKVCIVVHDGDTLTAEELMHFCVEKMPAFMVPRYIEFFDLLPKNAVGRIQKHLLRDHPIGPATWDRARP